MRMPAMKKFYVSRENNRVYIFYTSLKIVQKCVCFTLLEHEIQFIDLLKEAGYVEVSRSEFPL